MLSCCSFCVVLATYKVIFKTEGELEKWLTKIEEHQGDNNKLQRNKDG